MSLVEKEQEITFCWRTKGTNISTKSLRKTFDIDQNKNVCVQTSAWVCVRVCEWVYECVCICVCVWVGVRVRHVFDPTVTL